VLAVAMALVSGSYSIRPTRGVLVPVAEIAEGTSRVPIFVATTRQRSTTDPGEMFNGERAAAVSYASITVSTRRFPEDRRGSVAVHASG
jgi:esterase/lipase superfamily enzyme